MARYRRPKARKRTPIKRTKVYRNGMIQVGLLSIFGLILSMRTEAGMQFVSTVNNLVPGGKG